MSATAAVTAPTAGKEIVFSKRPIDGEEMSLVTLAREIAMDIHPIEQILKNHEITAARWEVIRVNPRFQQLLVKQVEEWNSALNTSERVKLKALSCIEEALPEFYSRMHDPKEMLPAKVKAFEAFANLAGLGKGTPNHQGGGEKFSVTINMGADEQIKISAPSVTVGADQDR